MRFRIVRVSDYLLEKHQPCNGAVKDGDKWFIDVADFDGLLALIDEVGVPLIIDRKEIRIYDDWNE